MEQTGWHGRRTPLYPSITSTLCTRDDAAATRFLYDRADEIAEYDGSGTLLRRHVHGPGTDEPIVWYEGSGPSDPRWLVADERGSIVAVTNASGAATDIANDIDRSRVTIGLAAAY